SVTSDQNDDDFADVDDSEGDSDNEFEVCSDDDDDVENDDDDEVDRHIDESIESVIQNSIQNDFDPNLNKSSRIGVIWTVLKNSEETKIRFARLCNENKSKFTYNDCGKTTCGTCLHEMVVRAMCKRCHDSKSI
ncbi:hypothetical protein BpHYR1_010984, partial [Brachionus plicatilis]